MRKMGLGRGLDALLPETAAEENDVRQIPLSEIDRNPAQPRRRFDDDALDSLAESIKVSGVLVPLIVTPAKGRYRIIAGERRFRAASRAGLESVPCIVRDMSRQQEMEAALVENLQREDLNALEEAEGIRSLMEECGFTQEQAAQRLGKSRPAVANALRLLALPADIQAALREGRISAGHGRVLAGVHDAELQHRLYLRTLNETLNVRQLEVLAALPEETNLARPHRPAPRLSPELTDMQERLQSAVGIRTSLTGSLKRGRVVLTYPNAEELELIYAALETLEGK